MSGRQRILLHPGHCEFLTPHKYIEIAHAHSRPVGPALEAGFQPVLEPAIPASQSQLLENESSSLLQLSSLPLFQRQSSPRDKPMTRKGVHKENSNSCIIFIFFPSTPSLSLSLSNFTQCIISLPPFVHPCI